MGKYDDAIGGVNINLSINEVLDEKSHKKVADKIEEAKKVAEEPIKIKIDSAEMDELLKQEKEIVKTIKQLSHLKINAKGISGLLGSNMSKADIQKTIDALNSLYDVQNRIRQASGNTKRIGSDFLSGFSANDIKTNLLPQLQNQLKELNRLGFDNIEQLRERERLSSRLAKITKKDLDNAKVRVVNGGDAEAEAKAFEDVVANRRQVVEEMKTSGLFSEQEIRDIERQNKGLIEQVKLLREIRVAKVKDGEKIVVQKEDDGGQSGPKKPRTRKPKEPSEADIARQRGEEMKAFVSQFEGLQKELGDTSKWFGKFNDFLNQIQQGSLTAAEAVAKLREEAAARAAEESRLAKEQEEAEQRALEFARQRAEEEARITREKAIRLQEIKKGTSRASWDAESYDRYADDPDGLAPDFAKEHKNNLLTFLGDDTSATENELKTWAQQIQERVAVVDDAVSRISKMSTVPKELKTTEELYKEAARVGQTIQTMYDGGITDTEEYIALQYKLLKIFDKIANAYGGVKGSGAKDRNELNQWMYRNMKDDTGFDFYGGSLVDALYSGKNSIYDGDTGKKQSMRDMAASLLGYKSDNFDGIFGFHQDLNDLKEINILLDIIEKRRVQLFGGVEEAPAGRKHSFSQTINGKSGKFSIKKPGSESYETESGQMSMLPAVEAETAAKNKLANVNEKVAKSQKKIKEEVQGTQTTMFPSDDLVDMTPDEADEWLNGSEEAKGFDKVGEAADKAAGKKKKFAKANKEVAASVTPSVEGLETEADAMEDVGEAAKKTNRVISEEAKSAAESMSFSTRDYERLYDEMEAFAEQRKAENGYDLSRVSVNTDAHGNPLGATISYYKKATKETITETFKIDKAAQEAEEGVNRLVLSSRKATAGIADFEKATLQAINRQDQLIAQKNKTVSSLSAVLDPNSNRSLAGTDYEEEANIRIQAIKDEVAKLDQVDSAGERIILPEKDFLAIKRRIAELTQDARDFINQSKNAEYAPTQLESHSVSSGNQYREDQLKAQMNEWKRAGIYVGDLKEKAEELSQSVTKITKHEDLKKYLEGMKEARALAKLATQDKKAEEERQKALNKEYEEYIALIAKRDAIESKMIGLDPEKNRDQLAPLKELYDKIDNDINQKYGDFLSRKDVQEHFDLEDFTGPDDEARLLMASKAGAISDKKRLEEEAEAQKKVNDTYKEYIALINRRGKYQKELVGLNPEKDRESINRITADINEVDEKLNTTYGDLLSNKIAQATLTLEDFMKYYDKWQREIADKEAKAADKARNKEEKPYRDYGKTTANSVVRKRDNLQGEIDALGVTNTDILDKMDVYKAKVQEVVDLRDQFANDPAAAKDPALVKKFQKASVEAERVRRGIKSVIDEEQKMKQMSKEQGFDSVELTSDQVANLENEMIAHARATAQGRMEIKGWNDDHTKMYYTVTNSKGVVEEMTMALGQGTNTMYQYRTATKETGTLMQQIFKGIKVKAKELLSFVIGGGSVYKAIEMLRQGIQYVREIDLALTELKKVTDETEETYDKFLETAAKTGARLGATISAVTEATATFAKLGYSMEQATEMAEAAIVYKNVGDNIASTEDAADSIISTMKGFKLEATESMEIVDRFNEVGNRFAITSQGIGEALRLSASALSEGGNSLDESIGLITAANEVVNDPSSVGTALKTLTLRLRGSKTELEEMGEDVSDMATTTSQLQAKLLALTGGQVDIMLDANTFKNSTQILREMAEAWEDMNDIQRASALELMGGRLLPLHIEICA